MHPYPGAVLPQTAANPTHFARFYDEDVPLVSDVVDFADLALRTGGVAIIIASDAHASAIQKALNGFGARQGEKWYSGQLIMLSAEETLDAICIDGWPDAQKFKAVVGELVQFACQEGRLVHAFGEMVDVLCERGSPEAALALEKEWQNLGRVYPFTLFCGYSAQLFKASGCMESLKAVCMAHDHVSADNGLLDDKTCASGTQLRALRQEVAMLKQTLHQTREAERTLSWRVQELGDFVENAAEGLHRVAGDGTILWANSAELRMLGYGYDEYVGRHIAEFHVDPFTIDKVLTKLCAGETLYDEPARLRCKDGSIKHVLIHSNGYFEDGQLQYTRCFTRDASDRLARAEAERQRDAALLHSPVAIAVLMGPECIVTLANPRYCKLFDTYDLIGKPFLSVFPEFATSALRGLFDAALDANKSFSINEFNMPLSGQHAAHQERYFSFNGEPVPAQPGGAPGIILAAFDVSAQVIARRQMERSHQEREGLLRELGKANRAKDGFLAMLGHELRNPLSPIVTALHLMRLRGDTTTIKEQEVIQRQVTHMVRLVDDLLDISRITRGKIELKKEIVHLDEVVAKSIEMVKVLLEERKHQLTVKLDKDLICSGDPIRLAQVFANLLSNAARYTPLCGRIEITAQRNEEVAVISVKDNGTGISTDLLPCVFEPFFQGPRGIDRAQGGLGIGLALVKAFVESHDGQVRAASAGAGLGSEFSITLPLLPRSTQTNVLLPILFNQAITESPKRVLLVDDNHDSVHLLAEVLRQRGHTVFVASDAITALQETGLHTPEVAVLDIGLPVMDGYELAAEIQRHLGRGKCRFLALTGYGQVSDMDRSLAYGFEMHLVKPIDPQALIAAVEDPPCVTP